MFELIQHGFNWFTEVSKTNPLMAGVLIPLIYLAKDLPGKLYAWCKSRCMVSLTITDERYTGKAYIAERMCAWFMGTRLSKWSRNLQIVFDYKDAIHLAPHVGLHLIWFERRLYILNISEKEASGQAPSYRIYRITRFGRSHEPIKRLIEAFSEIPQTDRIKIFHYANYWNKLSEITALNLDQLSIPNALRTTLKEQIQFFLDNKKWYIDRALAHKMTYLLTGEPGTGKTSIVRSIAYTYRLPVYCLDLSAVSNKTLLDALSNIPANAVLLIEDIDAMTGAVTTRKRSESSDVPVLEPANSEDSTLTLSGLLNALDGIAGLRDVMVFITTNYPERLDDALTRKARIDDTFEIGALTDAEVRHYYNQMYGEPLTTHKVYADIKSCDLHGLFLEHRFDPIAFEANLPTKG